MEHIYSGNMKKVLAAKTLFAMRYSNHYNFINPLVTLEQSAEFKRFLTEDKKRVKYMLEHNEGKMKSVNWYKVKAELQVALKNLVKSESNVKTRFINVEKLNFLVEIDDSIFEVDEKGEKNDMVVVHLEHSVLFAIPSKELGDKIFKIAEGLLGHDMTVPVNLAAAIKKLARNTPDSKPLGTMNFGLTESKQDEDRSEISRIIAVGGKCYQLTFRQVGETRKYGEAAPAGTGLNNLNESMRFYYEDFCNRIFNGDRQFFKKQPVKKLIQTKGAYKGKRDTVKKKPAETKKGHAVARLLKFYARHKKICIPSPLTNSVPEKSNDKLVLCATFENKARTLAEILLQLAFYPLPYATTPFLVADNLKSTFGRSRMPELTWMNRAFMKGTLCRYMEGKTIHDDENGAVSPSIWINFIQHQNTFLEFEVLNLIAKIQCSKNRFVLFAGFVPHSTNQITEGEEQRICISAYSKPLFEYLGLNICSKNVTGSFKYRAKVLNEVVRK